MVTFADPEVKDRIRAFSDPEINARIDKEMNIRLQWYANKSSHEIRQRLNELADEPTVESVLESRATLLAMTGAVLGTKPGPEVIAKLRKLSVRSRGEIERERKLLTTCLNRGTEDTEIGRKLN